MRKIRSFLSSLPGLIVVAALLLGLALAFSAAGRARQEVGMQPLVTPANPTSIPTLVPVSPTTIPPTPVPALAPVDVENVNVTLTYLSKDLFCKMSPRGDAYACRKLDSRGVPNELWLGSLSKGFERSLVKDVTVVNFFWAQDGRQIIYPVPPSEGPTDERSVFVEAPVFEVDTDTGDIMQIGVTEFGRELQPLPGGEVAFWRSGRLRLLNLATRAEREILGEVWNARDPFAYFQISPDGQKVALYGGGVISIANLKTRQVVFTVGGVSSPWHPMAWSSDGGKLAHATMSEGIVGEGGGIPELWVVNADGSDPQRLWAAVPPLGSYKWLEWLPGRNAILFIHNLGGDDASNHYQIISGDGGPPKELFTNGGGLRLSGNKFTFSREFTDDPADKGTWVATLTY